MRDLDFLVVHLVNRPGPAFLGDGHAHLLQVRQDLRPRVASLWSRQIGALDAAGQTVRSSELTHHRLKHGRDVRRVVARCRRTGQRRQLCLQVAPHQLVHAGRCLLGVRPERLRDRLHDARIADVRVAVGTRRVLVERALGVERLSLLAAQARLERRCSHGQAINKTRDRWNTGPLLHHTPRGRTPLLVSLRTSGTQP